MKVDTEGGRKKVPLSLRVGKKGKGGRKGKNRGKKRERRLKKERTLLTG